MQEVTASAPGSIMITGEHAVVYGHPAIVAAVDQRMTVTATQTEDPVLRITSEIAEPAAYPLEALPVEGLYRFVCAAVSASLSALNTGLSLSITSQIDPSLGLGSSAAVTIATLGALARLTDHAQDIHATALGIIRDIQGRGSGADLAASLHGGMIAYTPALGDRPTVVSPLPLPPPLSLRYTGYKTPTGEVLAQIAAAREGREAAFDALYTDMGACASATIAAAKDRDWDALAAHLITYQSLMARLGVSDPTIDGIISEATGAPGLMAAKISGSGLGDCVLALGTPPKGFVPAPITREGLVIHDHAR